MLIKQHRRLRAPKQGNSPHECEDASRIMFTHWRRPRRPDTARAVVADGASESAFAALWANTLTNAFVNQPPAMPPRSPRDIDHWLTAPRHQWRQHIPWRQLPWHGESKTRAGAHATLLGLTLDQPQGETQHPGDAASTAWHAIAVGDTCLFIVRDDQLHLAFPLQHPGDFDNSPPLVCSNPDNQQDLQQGLRTASGTCQTDDLFIIASDALAQWFLRQHHEGLRPWHTLQSLSNADWRHWTAQQQHQGAMRNDDTTMLTFRAA